MAVLTQLMSDAATTALFAPAAVILAQALGHPPEPYVVTMAMAAVASILTPVGHHGNLLVYGPGGYQFTDFIWVGTPLNHPRGVDRDLARPGPLAPMIRCRRYIRLTNARDYGGERVNTTAERREVTSHVMAASPNRAGSRSTYG
jgi:hypothetical protein